MKTTNSFSLILIFALLAVVSACAPRPAMAAQPAAEEPALVAPAPAAQEDPAPLYNEFTYPAGDQTMVFELPQGWDWWANAGYLSPDDGRTMAGLRFSWLQEGRSLEENESALFNEGAPVLAKDNVLIGELETHRYTVEVVLKSAATGEEIFHSYELIYAFPAPDGEQLIGVAVSAPSLDELRNLEPVAEHMAASLRWQAAE